MTGKSVHLVTDGEGTEVHDARHPLKDGLHRLRADRHDAVLDLARQALELVEAHDHRRAAGEARFGHTLGEHCLIDDELADQIDEAPSPGSAERPARSLSSWRVAIGAAKRRMSLLHGPVPRGLAAPALGLGSRLLGTNRPSERQKAKGCR